MLTFKQIEALYWTVRLGTFAASAQKLHTTQSAITKRIQELEADFDIALFDRSGYRAELTARGHEIYALAEEMLGHRDRLLVRLKGQHTLTGTFRFGITEITAMTWLPALIRLLRSHYPRITLEPHIDLGADLLKRLQAGQLDMAFLHGEFAEPGLEVAPLQRLEFAWMGSPDMIDASRVYTPADIAALPLLRQSQESGLNMIYDGWLAAHACPQPIHHQQPDRDGRADGGGLRRELPAARLLRRHGQHPSVGDRAHQCRPATIRLLRHVPTRRGRGVLPERGRTGGKLLQL